jgi:hypothetical protein
MPDFCNARFGRGRLLEKISKEKVTQLLYFTYAWGAYIKPFTMEVGLFFKVINAGYFHCANNGLRLSTSEAMSVLHCEAQCQRKSWMH